MSDPTLTQIDDRELENMSVDADNFPYKKTRGLLGFISGAWARITGRTVGSSNAVDVAIVDASGNQITSFGSSTVTANQGSAGTSGWLVVPQQPTGSRADGSVTLTSATTAYQVPASPPASPYLLVISANAANSTEMRWLTNTGTTLGHPIAPGAIMSIRLPASTALFLYSGTAGQIANFSTLIL